MNKCFSKIKKRIVLIKPKVVRTQNFLIKKQKKVDEYFRNSLADISKFKKRKKITF